MQPHHFADTFQFQEQQSFLPQGGHPSSSYPSAGAPILREYSASGGANPSSSNVHDDDPTSSRSHFQPMMHASNMSMGIAANPFTPSPLQSHQYQHQHQNLLLHSGHSTMGSRGMPTGASHVLQGACAAPVHTGSMDDPLDHMSDELEDFDPLPLNLGSTQPEFNRTFGGAPIPLAQPPFSLQRSSSVQDSSSVACTVQNKNENQSGNDMPQSSILQTQSLLHNSCKLYPDTLFIVESALRMDPNSIRYKVDTTSGGALMDNSSESSRQTPAASFRSLSKGGGQGADAAPGLFRTRKVVDAFGYPINIALNHNASNDVIDLLLREGPDVLSKPDGPDDASTLAIAIELGKDHEMLKRIMKANHQAVHTRDKYDNLPLHNLLRTRTSPLIESVRMVYRANPDALRSVNFHGHTPLDLAVRNESCSEQVLNYLHTVEFKDQEDRAAHLDDLVD